MAYKMRDVTEAFLEVMQGNLPEMAEEFLKLFKENEDGLLIVSGKGGSNVTKVLLKSFKAISDSLSSQILDELNYGGATDSEAADDESEVEDNEEEGESEETPVVDEEDVEAEEDDESEETPAVDEDGEAEEEENGEKEKKVVDKKVFAKIKEARGKGKVYNVDTGRIIAPNAKKFDVNEGLGVCGKKGSDEYKRVVKELIAQNIEHLVSSKQPPKKPSKRPLVASKPKKLALTEVAEDLFVIKGTKVVVEKIKEGKKLTTKAVGTLTAKNKVVPLKEKEKKIAEQYGLPYDE